MYIRPDDDEVAAEIADNAPQPTCENKTGQVVGHCAPVDSRRFALSMGFVKSQSRDFDVLFVGTRKEKVIRSLFLDLDLGTQEVASVHCCGSSSGTFDGACLGRSDFMDSK